MINKCCKCVFLQKSGNKAKNSDTETTNPQDNVTLQVIRTGTSSAQSRSAARVPVGLNCVFERYMGNIYTYTVKTNTATDRLRPLLTAWC